MEVKKVPITDLQQDPANARKHPEKNKKALAQSLKRFKAARSIVVDKNNVVRAGNGTIEAAAAAGIKDAIIVEASGNELVVVRRKDWSEAEAMAYALADNQLQATSEWDKDRLGFQLGALIAEGFEMDAIGFDKNELERLAKLPVLANMDDDVAPEPPTTPRTVPGDLYLLGRHRLLCGDSTKEGDVFRLMGGLAPLMMVTDPPYGVEYDPEWRDQAAKDGLISGGARATGKVKNDDRVDWTMAYKLFPGPVAYVWHAGIFAGDVALNLAQAELMIRAQIIWRKQTFAISRGAYHWQHEPCWYAVRKGAKSHWVGDRSQSTVWEAGQLKADDTRTNHGTQKPLELFRKAIANHDRGDEKKIVYDPFAGSGTAIIACEQLGAFGYSMEIDPAYCDVIVERWENLTKQKAVLA